MAALAGAAVFLAAVLIRVFSAPFRIVGRVLFNTLLGFLLLFGVNAAAPLTGLAVGVNLFTALTVGIPGVPGLGLLLLLQWVF